MLSIVFTVVKAADPGRRRRRRLPRRAGHLAVPDGALRQLRGGAGRSPGKAQADAQRGRNAGQAATPRPCPHGCWRHRVEERVSTHLKAGDLVIVEAGEFIPGDGEIVDGVASIDESAITGESAPVDARSGRRPLRCHRRHPRAFRPHRRQHHRRVGKSFLDRMIALVEGAARQRTPNEIALSLVFGVHAHLSVSRPRCGRSPVRRAVHGRTTSGRRDSKPRHRRSTLVALLVCLIPTTIGRCSPRSALPAWTGRCGPTSSPRAARPSKSPATSTRCCSTRPARSRWATGRQRSSSRGQLCGGRSRPAGGAGVRSRRDAGRQEHRRVCSRKPGTAPRPAGPSRVRFVAFTAQTRMSGMDLPDGRSIRKGAAMPC